MVVLVHEALCNDGLERAESSRNGVGIYVAMMGWIARRAARGEDEPLQDLAWGAEKGYGAVEFLLVWA